MTTALCHRCRFIRPLALMRIDDATRSLLHTGAICRLPGGLMECDPAHVTCGSAEQATGRLASGARIELLGEGS